MHLKFPGGSLTLHVPFFHIPILLAIALASAVADPFGDGNSYSGFALFLWWAAIVATSYACGEFVAQNYFLPLCKKGRLVLAFVTGPVLGAVSVTLGNIIVVYAMTRIAGKNFSLVYLFGSATPVSYIVAVTRYSILHFQGNSPPSATSADIAPGTSHIAPEARILDRLPTFLGDDLLYFQSRDHYVEFTTSKGAHLELMRFRDALEECDELNGVQIRRGCWIATDAVRSSAVVNRKLVLETRDDQKHVVSRTYRSTVKERLRV